MRLLLSATASTGGEIVDLAVECEDAATVGDVARHLARVVSMPKTAAPEPQVIHSGGRHLGIVADPLADDDVVVDLPPTLYVGGRRLDPSTKVVDSDLRNGVLVGLDTPLPDVFAERGGVVEIRTTSGASAGRIDFLAPGRHEIGTGAMCTIRVVDGGHLETPLPEVALHLDVALDGTVTVTPDPSILRLMVPQPIRAEKLDGPIVVPKHETPENPTRRARRRRKKKKKKFKHEMAELARLKHPNETIDPIDDRPFVHMDRVAIDEPTLWQPGTAIVLGDVMLELAAPTLPDASLSPSPAGATLDYNRPPRLLPPPRTTDFRMPTEPRKPDKPPLPWPMMMMPIVMGGSMWLMTGRWYSLIIMVASPLMFLFNYINGKKHRRGKYAEDMRHFVERMRRIEGQAYEALVTERGARRRDLPDPAAVLLFATGPRARLWERRRTDPDWLFARVGTADVPSEVSMLDPAREDHERTLNWTAPDVPAHVPLQTAGVTGVAGIGVERRQVAAWMVAQAAALHSPADVEIMVLSDPEGDEVWNWVRWLPHVRRSDDTDVIAGVGTDDETTGRRVAELMSILESRKAQAQDTGGGFVNRGGPVFPPLLVVLDGARRIRMLPGLVTLLRDGPAHNMLFICIDVDERQLPEECHAVISLVEGRATVAITGEADIEGVRPDLVSPQWCERLGRALAPVKDVSSEDLSSVLPNSSRLLDVLKLDPATPESILSWWERVGRTTKAVIGEGMDGPFSIDIRTDGPHGLVAGTTGSGKSELLQTIIASLAVGNRPDEMTFVLVDYKGGAAFKDCNHLPHTVGMVTDLDGHLTTRALASLTAELHRREHQLADADAKDIEDYLAAKEDGDEPMPRLMIVIDEFAALVAELPDFVKGLVDIARRGRSLGVHLILATQRPAGVVSAEIKSNTNLRIALRVTDRGDSQDVIESPESAEIAKSMPGRAYARLGHSSLVAFQSSRVGGRPVSSDAEVEVGLRPLSWSSIGRPPERGPEVEEEDDVSTPTDLASLVGAITQASQTSGVHAPPPPWLPPLDEIITLDDVLADPSAPSGIDGALRLPFGLMDVPSQQRKAVSSYDLTNSGHLSIIGAARSGRSTVLRAFAGVIGRTTSPADIHLYGVDCGNNALLSLVGLPHTGAVVSRDQPDRLSRLSGRLRAEIGRRQQVLAEQGFADIAEQRANVAPDQRLPYIVVLFDRWEGFVQAFENVDSGRLIDQWMQILQEGTGVGVKVILASDRTGMVGRLSTLLEDKLLLKLTDPADYGHIGMPAKTVPEHIPAGRGFRADGIVETQVALLGPDPAGTAQVAVLQSIAREATERHADVPRSLRPFRVDPLPNRISLSAAMDLLDQPLRPTQVPVAVGGDTLTLRSLDAIDHGPGFLILGPRRSGRSTAMTTMTSSMLDRGWKVALLTPRRSPLSELATRSGVVTAFNLDIEKDEATTLFEALEPESGGPNTALIVDDVELMGVDGWLVDLLTKHVGKLRDSGSVVIAAGTTDDLGSSYRGPVATLKKSRSGLLLSPGAPSDGDHFGLKLPRSMTGGMPPGRGLFVAGGQWQLGQVAEPG